MHVVTAPCRWTRARRYRVQGTGYRVQVGESETLLTYLPAYPEAMLPRQPNVQQAVGKAGSRQGRQYMYRQGRQ